MRAARLLEHWADAATAAAGQIDVSTGNAPGSKACKSRPWPCFDPSNALKQQAKQLDAGHALPKPWADWSPEQRTSAAEAAAGWMSELARGQQLLAATLQRAEQAEMELAALRLDGNGSGSSRPAKGSGKPATSMQLLGDGATAGKVLSLDGNNCQSINTALEFS